MRKPFLLKNNNSDQLCGNPSADQHLCFSYIYIVLSLYFLNQKFQASSHLLWLYSPVWCVTWLETRQTDFLMMRLTLFKVTPFCLNFSDYIKYFWCSKIQENFCAMFCDTFV